MMRSTAAPKISELASMDVTASRNRSKPLHRVLSVSSERYRGVEATLSISALAITALCSDGMRTPACDTASKSSSSRCRS
eukprot:scaffold265518_cov33-Tisochrysis_lutea.AAC.2